MASIGRNEPCPCGSGRRYKDCHGALTRSGVATTPPSAEQHRLEAALTAQRSGRFADAISLYEAVLAADPDNFDALHMRGVVAYQCGDFDRARDWVTAALRLRPVDQAARFNLRLIGGALERRLVEREICREVLPRLRRRCVIGTDSRLWPGSEADLIICYRDMSARWPALRVLMQWLGAPPPTLWHFGDTTPPLNELWDLRVLGRDGVPRAGRGIFFGAERSPAEWYASWRPGDIVLYCSDETHCLLLDRIPELARDGETPIRLLFGSSAHAKRVGLPGLIVREVTRQEPTLC